MLDRDLDNIILLMKRVQGTPAMVVYTISDYFCIYKYSFCICGSVTEVAFGVLLPAGSSHALGKMGVSIVISGSWNCSFPRNKS